MADWGSANGRNITRNLVRGLPGTFAAAPDPVFDINAAIGIISGRSLGAGGGAGEVEYIDRPVFTATPPSANSAGDWPMRFYAAEMEPEDIFGNSNTLYVCEASSKLYVRYYEVKNLSGGPIDVTLTMAEWPFEVAETVANGASLISPDPFNMILWPGDVIQGHISADEADVWLLISGVETVT